MASLVDVDRPYGSTTRPLHLARVLAQSGAELLHVCTHAPASGHGIEWLSTGEAGNGIDAATSAEIASRCRAFAPDVFYVHQVFDASPLVARVAAALDTPMVFDAHGSPAMEAPTFTDLSPVRLRELITIEHGMLRQAAHAVVPSTKLREFLAGQYGIDSAGLAVVRNGVDTRRFRPAPADRSLPAGLGIPPDATVIALTCPRLATFPTNSLALQHFFCMVPPILEALADAWFVVLGDGPMPEPPSPRVRYAGFVGDLPAWLNAADVCVAPFPAQAVCGGTRNKVIEYLACGRPVVSTSEGMCGFDDAQPGREYLLADDAAGFVNAVVSVCRQPELARGLGEAARRLSQSYDWRDLGSRVQSLLTSVCESARADRERNA